MKKLYRVDCNKKFTKEQGDGEEWYRVFTYAEDENAAIAIARDTEDEDGPMIYGDPIRAVQTTHNELDRESGAIFPAGYWYAFPDVAADLEEWRKDNRHCTQTLDMFAEATT